MLPFMLLLTGGTISLYCLWQFRRWLSRTEAAVSAAPRRLEVLVDELIAAAETTAAAVEEKAEALAGLLEEADRKLGQLQGAPGDARPAREEPAARPMQSTEAPPMERGAVPLLPPAPTSVAVLQSNLSEAHAGVYRLADAGMDVTGIARQLGMTKGEVQLILGLRPRR